MKSVQNNKNTMQQRKPMPWLHSFKTAIAAAVLTATVGMAGIALAAVLSDYTVIQNETPVRIGDGQKVWRQPFNTGGRRTSEAFLTLNVKGLTFAESGAEVWINGHFVGSIHPYDGREATDENWYSQTIVFSGSFLNPGDGKDNEIQIWAVTFPGANSSNLYDDFFVKSVICHFHQES